MLALFLASLLSVGSWVPARWASSSAGSLELLDGSPVNCLLLERKDWSAEFVQAAAARQVVTLGIIRPEDDYAAAAGALRAAKLDGAVLEGNWAAEQLAAARKALPQGDFPIIELLPRVRLRLREPLLVAGTYQGVWPGIQVEEEGKTHAGPTGAPWIHTNAGFLRFVRAATSAPVWMANLPPANRRLTAQHYQQAVADAAIAGARWVMALDAGFWEQLLKKDSKAVENWKRIHGVAAFYEAHPEWRTLRATGGLAVVQEPDSGALLSGGILDMIAVKHTPVRPVPLWKLDPALLKGAQMAVNVDAESATPEQKEALRAFARGGGTLLNGPPGNRGYSSRVDNITLDEKEVANIDNLWRGVNSMIGRENLGARLFNVASMLSNLLANENGSQLVLHLVNYSGYPVDNVTAQIKGAWKKATVYAPDAAPREAVLFEAKGITDLEIETVGACATIVLE